MSLQRFSCARGQGLNSLTDRSALGQVVMKGTIKPCRRLIAFLVGVCTVTWLPGCLQPAGDHSISDNENEPVESAKLSDEVISVLERKTRLVEALALQDRIVAAVRKANRENEALSDEEILAQDAHWQGTDGIDEFIKPFLTNDCADALVEFQEAHDAFPELLVTDSRGLLVAASNKSSDYLQADEAWWKETFDDGRGHVHTGSLEYDESARSEAISVYVPIRDPDDRHVIGVIKAVCDVTAIKLEL